MGAEQGKREESGVFLKYSPDTEKCNRNAAASAHLPPPGWKRMLGPLGGVGAWARRPWAPLAMGRWIPLQAPRRLGLQLQRAIPGPGGLLSPGNLAFLQTEPASTHPASSDTSDVIKGARAGSWSLCILEQTAALQGAQRPAVAGRAHSQRGEPSAGLTGSR